MLEVGVQTKNVVDDRCPREGFELMRSSGFSCGDFSLNGYLFKYIPLSVGIEYLFRQVCCGAGEFFGPHRSGAREAGIRISQMHMPYPNYVPKGSRELNDYLQNVVAPKSMAVCAFF